MSFVNPLIRNVTKRLNRLRGDLLPGAIKAFQHLLFLNVQAQPVDWVTMPCNENFDKKDTGLWKLLNTPIKGLIAISCNWKAIFQLEKHIYSVILYLSVFFFLTDGSQRHKSMQKRMEPTVHFYHKAQKLYCHWANNWNESLGWKPRVTVYDPYIPHYMTTLMQKSWQQNLCFSHPYTFINKHQSQIQKQSALERV